MFTYGSLWGGGSQDLPPRAHVSLTDANESYACVLRGEKALWMVFSHILIERLD